MQNSNEYFQSGENWIGNNEPEFWTEDVAVVNSAIVKKKILWSYIVTQTIHSLQYSKTTPAKL